MPSLEEKSKDIKNILFIISEKYIIIKKLVNIIIINILDSS